MSDPVHERTVHEARSAILAALYDDGCLTTPQTDHIAHVLDRLAANLDRDNIDRLRSLLGKAEQE